MCFNSEEIFFSKNFQPDPFWKIIFPSDCGSTWQKKCKGSRQLEWTQIERNGQASSELQAVSPHSYFWKYGHKRTTASSWWTAWDLQAEYKYTEWPVKSREAEEEKNHWDLQKSAQAKECILKYYPSENTNQRKLETFNSFQTISTLKFTEAGLFWVI